MKIAFLTSFNSDMFKKDFERYLAKSNIKCELLWNGYSLHEQFVFDEFNLFAYKGKDTAERLTHAVEMILKKYMDTKLKKHWGKHLAL